MKRSSSVSSVLSAMATMLFDGEEDPSSTQVTPSSKSAFSTPTRSTGSNDHYSNVTNTPESSFLLHPRPEQEDIEYAQDFYQEDDQNWSANIVSSALESLKSGWKPAPDAVNTSAESSQEDKEEGINLDIQELENELRDRRRSRLEDVERPQLMTNTTPHNLQKPSPRKPDSRSVTPIMRMRDESPEYTMDGLRSELYSDQTAEDQYKLRRQKRWKEKMKQAKLKKAQERSKLDGTRRQRRYRLPRAICHNDLTDALEGFVGSRCGNLEDTLCGDSSSSGSDSEYDDDTVESNSFYDEDDEEESTLGRITEVSSSLSRETGASKSRVPDPSKSPTLSNLGIKDKQFIRTFILTMKTVGFKVNVMQPSSNLNSKPVRCMAYIESGKLSQTGCFEGPKLVWNGMDGKRLGTVDLFELQSLDKATALQLENYPLAIPGQSLFLRLNGLSEYVFETNSEDEALQFIHGMRWVIARLAFNLIVGNLSVSCEILNVERTDPSDDCYGKFPSTVKEESLWTLAMNDVTSHLVDKAVTNEI